MSYSKNLICLNCVFSRFYWLKRIGSTGYIYMVVDQVPFSTNLPWDPDAKCCSHVPNVAAKQSGQTNGRSHLHRSTTSEKINLGSHGDRIAHRSLIMPWCGHLSYRGTGFNSQHFFSIFWVPSRTFKKSAVTKIIKKLKKSKISKRSQLWNRRFWPNSW